jgi:magnesium transporter
MDVYTISDAGIDHHSAEDLEHLLEQKDRLIWVDLSLCTPKDATVLSGVFGFHDLAVRDCVERTHVSKIHFYPDHVFTVVHAPELGTGGHVHYVELDQFIGPNYLVTVHGPLNPIVKPEVALRDTALVLRHIEAGDLRPQSPMALSGAILSALVRRETDLIATLAKESGRLEQQVTDDDHSDDPEALLEELFEVWQELLAIRTMAAHAGATYSRMAKLVRSLPESERPLITDIADRFDLIRSIAQDQRDFVHGVIEFFQTRTSTHTSIATEQLAADSVRQNDDMRKITAWVAIIAVPTAVTGFFGQNVTYPGFGEKSGFIVSTVIIVIVAVILWVTFKLKKWL